MCKHWFVGLINMVYNILLDLLIAIFYGRFLYFINPDVKAGYCPGIGAYNKDNCPSTIWFPLGTFFYILSLFNAIALIIISSHHLGWSCTHKWAKFNKNMSEAEQSKNAVNETYLWYHGSLGIDFALKAILTLSLAMVYNHNLWPTPIPDMERHEVGYLLLTCLILKLLFYLAWTIAMLVGWYRESDSETCFRSHPKAQTFRTPGDISV